MSTPTIFERILAGEIPCKKVLENEWCLAFHDITPQAPIHVLVIPKKKITNVAAANPEDALQLGQLLLAAKQVAVILGISETGFRLVFNNGRDGGQSVDYLHCHVLGGRKLAWPPG
jgi:histidine triad (HIT) family protein